MKDYITAKERIHTYPWIAKRQEQVIELAGTLLFFGLIYYMFIVVITIEGMP